VASATVPQTQCLVISGAGRQCHRPQNDGESDPGPVTPHPRRAAFASSVPAHLGRKLPAGPSGQARPHQRAPRTRDPNTTRRYYARSKQKQASRIYHEHVLKVREEAGQRLARRSRRAFAEEGAP